MDLYREEILDHYKNPRNFGDLDKPNVKAREANASCGDLIELQFKLRESTIADVAFKGSGCALSIAAASLLTEALKGKTIDEALKFDEQTMLDLLGIEVSGMRMKCVLLPFRALEEALKNHKINKYGRSRSG